MPKHIKTESDLVTFQRSSGFKLILSYLERLCLAAKGQLVDCDVTADERRCLTMLSGIEQSVHEIQPVEQPMRFGNKAFRTFHSWLEDNIKSLLEPFVVLDPLQPELEAYLLDSFGNPVRLDYGTGHEASFFMFLIVLMESGKLSACTNIILVIFKKYVALVRLITNKYTMEPAGSHGVWGLDDYHHLPFLFGAAQLIGHEQEIAPSTMLEKCKENFLQSSLYADMIGYIKNTKCKYARFSEVSPLLSDLARLDNWSKVCMGLLRMYKVEVLGKRPIAQHFYFGSVISLSEKD